MKQILLQMSDSASEDFLIIIHTYSALLKEKEIVKDLSLDSLKKHSLIYIKDNYEADPYDRFDSGLSKFSIESIEKKFDSLFDEETNKITNSLVKNERKFKYLKHKFKENHPECTELLELALTEHKHNLKKEKHLAFLREQKIVSFSDRFMSFFKYMYGLTEGDKIAFNQFTYEIFKKYDLNFKCFLFEKIEKKILFKEKVLNPKEIEFVYDILIKVLNCVTNEDIERISHETAVISSKSSEYSLNSDYPKLKAIIEQIIIKNMNRFKKLRDDYSKI